MRQTSGGSGSAEPDAARRSTRIQLADNARSDAVNDPVAEAATRAAAAARHNSGSAHSQAKPVDGENFWQTLGSRFSHEVKSALWQIGQAEAVQSYNNFTEANDEANGIAHALRAYADYRAQPWLDAHGRRMEVSVINTGDPVTDHFAQIGREVFEPSAPLMRPATNADWIDPLVNLASVAAMAAGPAFRLAGPAAEALDTAGATTIAADGAKTVSTLDQLSAAASRAAAKVGPGSGRFHGTAMHSAFRVEVDALGNSSISTEQSYLNGRVVSYGTPQSVRVDVVEGHLDSPTAMYDLKTGKATLTSSRIRQIRSHLPPGAEHVPFHEVRP